ncbi:hypothetical protein ACNOYE_12760 [Nannocystaceae bacterium ST9]
MLGTTRFSILAAFLSLSIASPTEAMAEGQTACDESDIYLLVDISTKTFYRVEATGPVWIDDQLAIGFGDSLSTVTVHFALHPSTRQGVWNFTLWQSIGLTRTVSFHQSDSTGQLTLTIDRPDDSALLSIYLGDTVTGAGASVAQAPPEEVEPVTVPDLVIEPQTGCPEDEFMLAER